MLQEIKVSQFAIIDSLVIDFQNGLNIISGETGSGKSVLLKSLSLLMGEKSSSDVIRTGYTSATVEGIFSLKDRPDLKERLISYDIPIEDNQLIVRRIISAEDKSRVYLNGVSSSLTQLREFVAPLVEITGNTAPLIEMTGQHDNRNLLSKKYHLDLLDQYSQVSEKRAQYEHKYESYLKMKTELEAFQKGLSANLDKLDFLKYQYTEFKNLNIDPVKDADLENEIKMLKSSSKLISFNEACNNLVYENDDSISAQLKTLIKKANEISPINETLAEKADGFKAALEKIDETVFEISQYSKKINLDPEALDEKESRLSQIRKLQKKYGSDLDQMVTEFETIQTQISQLENSEGHLEKMRAQLSQLEKDMMKIALELHAARDKNASELSKKVNSELQDLNMKGVTFSIETKKAAELNPHGITEIEFLSQTSPKDPKKPLSKVSSGGELSRILLALKTSVGRVKSFHDLPRTYLFDEVDTGVSGVTAEKVGRKLKDIAKGQQVICVTHLPQVAACGDAHYAIQKQTVNGQAMMEVVELNKKERTQEIARLISGEKVTKTSLAHAEQLLKDLR